MSGQSAQSGNLGARCDSFRSAVLSWATGNDEEVGVRTRSVEQRRPRLQNIETQSIDRESQHPHRGRPGQLLRSYSGASSGALGPRRSTGQRKLDSHPVPKRNIFRNIFRKIETVSDAEGVIRSASILVLLYAGVKVILAASIDVALLLDALLLALVAVPLLIFKNRFAAIAMVVLISLVTLDAVV